MGTIAAIYFAAGVLVWLAEEKITFKINEKPIANPLRILLICPGIIISLGIAKFLCDINPDIELKTLFLLECKVMIFPFILGFIFATALDILLGSLFESRKRARDQS